MDPAPRTAGLGLPPALHAVAQAQDGLVTWTQLIDSGLAESTALRRTARWQRVHPGVWYTTPAHDGSMPLQLLARAALLHAGPESRICLETAAHLHGFADGTPSVITIFVPFGCKVETRPGLVVRRERPGVRLPSVGTLPATGIEDTVLDLTNEGGPTAAIGWVTRAVQRRLTTPARLRERLKERHRMKHRELLKDLLTDVEAGATTPLEVRALRTVFRPHGLPMGDWQARVGGLGYIVDILLAEYGVVIELDGRRGHVEDGAFRDRQRDNAHARRGWTTLRFGWADVAGNPCAVAAQIRGVLMERGWPGSDRVHDLCGGEDGSVAA